MILDDLTELMDFDVSSLKPQDKPIALPKATPGWIASMDKERPCYICGAPWLRERTRQGYKTRQGGVIPICIYCRGYFK